MEARGSAGSIDERMRCTLDQASLARPFATAVVAVALREAHRRHPGSRATQDPGEFVADNVEAVRVNGVFFDPPKARIFADYLAVAPMQDGAPRHSVQIRLRPPGPGGWLSVSGKGKCWSEWADCAQPSVSEPDRLAHALGERLRPFGFSQGSDLTTRYALSESVASGRSRRSSRRWSI